MKKLRSVLLSSLVLFASGLSLPAQTTSGTTTSSSSIVTQLQAISAEQAQLAASIKILQGSAATLVTQNGALTTTNATLTTDSTAKAATITSLQAQNTTLTNQVATLQAQLNSSGQITADLQKALDDLKAASKANADLLKGGGGTTSPPPPPVSVDDATILGELADSSLAGMNKRLGPSAAELNPSLVVPDVWMRGKTATTGGIARSFFSDALGAQSDQPWDYGSTEAQFIAVADDALVVNPATPTAHVSDGGPGPNNGTGVYRLRSGEWGDGAVSEFSAVMWNGVGSAFPDKDTVGHTASYGMGDKLGHPIAVARARINRYDGGFVLYDESRGGVGYIGTVGTQTAFSPWSGLTLPAGKMPLSLAVTSQNEFLLVGVYDRATGKGQVGIIALWGGTADGKSFPFDFTQPMPGLVNSGVIIGMKVIAWVDLPIKYPTNISAACSRNPGSDRIEGADGNAAYLSAWDLSTKVLRDTFMAKNGGWISTWGKACITSKYESKAVMFDMTAMFQGYRDQYFTTDALYAASRPQSPTNAWYAIYDVGNPAVWPNLPATWTPVVSAIVDVPNPTAVLMGDQGAAEVAVASPDGTIRYFKFDGTADGSTKVGPNPTCLNPDKYPAAGGPRGGGYIVTCRGDRSVVLVNKMGAGASIMETIRDQRMVDPVAAEVGDTHGVEMRYITVVDFNGKQTLNYRDTKLVFSTQGGAIYGTGPTTTADKAIYDKAVVDGTALPPIHEELECGGVYAIPGHPFAVSGSNVN